MAAQPIAHMTPEEYLEWERASRDVKHEYYRGEVFAMAGGSLAHGTIIFGMAGALISKLAGRRCNVAGDIRVQTTHDGLYAYPDIVVVCGEARFSDTHPDTLLNPVLIAEVLSPSTEAYDRGFRFAQYRLIESLQEYVLISQSEPRVERFVRQASGDWLMSEAVGMEAVCRFASLDCEASLADIYRMVTFEPPPEIVPTPA